MEKATCNYWANKLKRLIREHRKIIANMESYSTYWQRQYDEAEGDRIAERPRFLQNKLEVEDKLLNMRQCLAEEVAELTSLQS